MLGIYWNLCHLEPIIGSNIIERKVEEEKVVPMTQVKWLGHNKVGFIPIGRELNSLPYVVR